MKPCGEGQCVSPQQCWLSCGCEVGFDWIWWKKKEKEQTLTAKASSALWLSVVSSGLSTGVWRVNLVSNWLTSSSDCCRGTRARKEGLRGHRVLYAPFMQLHHSWTKSFQRQRKGSYVLYWQIGSSILNPVVFKQRGQTDISSDTCSVKNIF